MSLTLVCLSLFLYHSTMNIVWYSVVLVSTVLSSLSWPPPCLTMHEYNITVVEKTTILFLGHINIRGAYDKFPDFFRMGTFIDSTHMKLYSPSRESLPVAMHLMYRSNSFWKVPWKSSCMSVSMTFVTASFISSLLS